MSAGLVALAAALPPEQAAASGLVLFDLNDFGNTLGSVKLTDVATTAYGCGGKSFCTVQDVINSDLSGVSGPASLVSKTIDGITATFSRPNSEFEIHAIGGNGLFLAGTPTLGDLHPYPADFSSDLTAAQVDLERPGFLGAGPDAAAVGVGSFLELWSGPGATGTLVGREELLPQAGDQFNQFAGELVTLGVSAHGTLRSVLFGSFLPDVPGCESSCVVPPSVPISGAEFQVPADNVGVTPVPEPMAAIPFGVGLVVASRRLRVR